MDLLRHCRHGWRSALGPGLLGIILVATFCYTLIERAPWLDAFERDPFQTITSADLGLIEGLLRTESLELCAELIADPSGTGVRELAEALPPVWTPAHHLLDRPLAPYRAASALSRAAVVRLLACAGSLRAPLFMHLTASLCLSWWIFALLRKVSFENAASFLCALIPGLAVQLVPGGLYWPAGIADPISAELALFALAVALEPLSAGETAPRATPVLLAGQTAALALGVLLDPLFAVLGFLIVLVRVLRKPFPRFVAATGIQVLVVAAAAMAVLLAGSASSLRATPAGGDTTVAIAQTLPFAFGDSAGALWVLCVTAVIGLGAWLSANRRVPGDAVRDLFCAMSLVIVPVFVRQAWITPASHAGESAALLYVIPMATVPFALLPATLTVLLARYAPRLSLGRLTFSLNRRSLMLSLPLIPCASLLLGGLWLFDAHRGFRGQFAEPTRYAKLATQASDARPMDEASLPARLEAYSAGLRLSEEAALIDYRLQHVAGDRFRLRLLFRVLSTMPDNYLIGLSAFVPSENLASLPWDRAGTTHDVWDFQPAPPVIEWRPGDLVLTETEVTARADPYEVHLFFCKRAFADGWQKEVHGQELVLDIANAHRPTQPVFLRNPGFENWAGGIPDGWEPAEEGRARLAPSDAGREGILGVAVAPGAAPVDLAQRVRCFAPMDGRALVFAVNAQSWEPGTTRIGISFAGRTAWGVPHPGDGQWHTVSVYCAVPHTFGDGALDVIIRSGGSVGRSCLFDGATLDVL